MGSYVKRKKDLVTEIQKLYIEKYGSEVGAIMIGQLFQKYVMTNMSFSRDLLESEYTFLRNL